MTGKITVTEFAKRKGVSRALVLRGITDGKIKATLIGRAYEIDWHTQARAWDDNYKHPQKRPQNIGGGRPRSDGMPAAAPRGAPERPAPADDEEGQPKPRSLADIQRDREAVKLQIDLETLKRVRGESVLKVDEERAGRKLAGAVISALYSIPDRVSDVLSGMSDANAIQQLLLQEIDQAVAGLRKAYAQDNAT